MKFFLLYTVWLGYLLSMSYNCAAEDLLEIYRKAVRNDPQVLGAKNVNNAAEEGVKQAAGQLSAQINFQYTRGKVEEKVDESENIFFNPVGDNIYDNVNYSLSFTQPLFNWSLLKSYHKAESELLQADAEFLSVQQDLVLRVIERYLEVLSAKDEIALVLSEKAALQRQLQQVQLMLHSGTAPKSELYDVQARYASVQADEISARNTYNDSLEALREIVGDILGPLAELKPNMALVAPNPRDPGAWIKMAIEQNPRVIVRSRAVDAARHQISADRAGHLPVLSLSASINQSDDLNNSTGTDEETRELFVTLEVPLFQGGVVSARARRSYQLYEKAFQDLREVKNSIQRSTREAYDGIIGAISRVEALDKSVAAQVLALDQRRKGFRSGLYNALDVLDAERNVYEARRDYAGARYDYLLNWLRLKHATGTMTEAEVQEINQWLQKEQS